MNRITAIEQVTNALRVAGGRATTSDLCAALPQMDRGAILGSLAPVVVKPLFYAWMTMALALGFVMTRVLLTIFFFLVLTPVALIFRLIGRDALHRKLDRDAPSYWIKKQYLIEDRSRFEKFF